MEHLAKLILVSFVAGISACGTVQPTPAPVDYAALCAHLQDIGCPEGAKTNCVETFTSFQGGHMADLRPQCLLDAEQKSDARNCGSIDCQ